MTLDFVHAPEQNTKKCKKSNNQRIFFMRDSTLSVQNLTETDELQVTLRCGKCGIPLRKQFTVNKPHITLDDIPNNMQKKICNICRREEILNRVLISSYVISALIFVMGIIGVIVRWIPLDLVLLVGCLEIIFLLFWGRFLEEAVFFGLSRSKKLLTSLYRYSVSAEIQNFDVALNYMQKTKTVNDELVKGFLQVTVHQANFIPTDWFYLISEQMNIPRKDLLHVLSSQVDEENEMIYLERLITKAPATGISLLTEIFLLSDNTFGLTRIVSVLENKLAQEKLEKDWLNEFYIYKHIYRQALQLVKRDDLLELIDNQLENYREPKVPTIDVLESSKGFIQKNPFIRYILRIFFYIGLAFLLGLIYQWMG
jgi:hypothetical protein